MLSTRGSRQFLWLPAAPAKCSANLMSQFTTAMRPSGSSRENVAPRTLNDPCWAGGIRPKARKLQLLFLRQFAQGLDLWPIDGTTFQTRYTHSLPHNSLTYRPPSLQL